MLPKMEIADTHAHLHKARCLLLFVLWVQTDLTWNNLQ